MGNRFSAKGNLMLLSHETQGILEAGTRIGADGHIWSPEKDLNLFYVDSVTAIEASRCSASLRLRILAWAQQRLDLLGEPIAGALLLGTASAEGRVKGLAVQAGVAHVLALSGMHLQFFVLLIMPILTLMFGAAKGRMVAYPFALGYVMLVGFKPSLTRALLMLSLGPWKRRFGMITILWMSYVVQTICFPKTIDSEGALLSYASLAAILARSFALCAFPSVSHPHARFGLGDIGDGIAGNRVAFHPSVRSLVSGGHHRVDHRRAAGHAPVHHAGFVSHHGQCLGSERHTIAQRLVHQGGHGRQ